MMEEERTDIYRIEHDSMGDVKIPKDAYWGAQTERAIGNFPVSGIAFPPVFIRALSMIKQACAIVNRDDGALDVSMADAVIRASAEAASGKFDSQFPLDIFQTGSGTSTNMNANEVIATRANELLSGQRHTTHPVHPNDHVNMGQSSNDVIPSAIHTAVCLQTRAHLLPALELLEGELAMKERQSQGIVKTGRTHLMDAVPITFAQELSGWRSQIETARLELIHAMEGLSELALGGTAIGTGINAREGFGRKVCDRLSELTEIHFREASNHFQAQSSLDRLSVFSGALRTYATSLLKISNDLRLMNSGPFSGMGEIRLASLQPGSSIMPGKVNPVIPEAARMVCLQVLGNDMVVSTANAMGEFQLNVMLPVAAHNCLQSVSILGSVTVLVAEKAIRTFDIDREHAAYILGRNPIIATILNPVIGYEKAAQAVKKALAEKKTVKETVVELGFVSKEEAERLLDPIAMTHP
ncbi:MAG: class II fumarate hydratase [Acidobacteriota bacterium]